MHFLWQRRTTNFFILVHASQSFTPGMTFPLRLVLWKRNWSFPPSSSQFGPHRRYDEHDRMHECKDDSGDLSARSVNFSKLFKTNTHRNRRCLGRSPPNAHREPHCSNCPYDVFPRGDVDGSEHIYRQKYAKTLPSILVIRFGISFRPVVTLCGAVKSEPFPSVTYSWYLQQRYPEH